jgi:hypothetical protein
MSFRVQRSGARSDFRTPVESIGLQKPENLLLAAALGPAVDRVRKLQVCLLVLVAACFLVQRATAAQVKEVRRVLFLCEAVPISLKGLCCASFHQEIPQSARGRNHEQRISHFPLDIGRKTTDKIPFPASGAGAQEANLG